MKKIIKKIYDLEINKNIREKYEKRGLLNTDVPLFEKEQEAMEP